MTPMVLPSGKKASRGVVKSTKKPGRPSSVSKGPRSSSRQSTQRSLPGSPLLLELGTEELPALFIQPTTHLLGNLLEKTLNDNRLTYVSIQTFGTSRRLVVLVNGLVAKQSSISQEVLGPPQSFAYDAQGVPTKAAKGFASSQGIPVESLQIRETPKGAYVCATKHESGRPTVDVLKEHLPKIIQQLSFKKSMKWNDSKLRFARPLRWVLALYGKKSLRFEIGGIVSGSHTVGHRFLSPSSSKRTTGIKISDPTTYEATMKRHCVVVDPHERRSMIQVQVSVLAKSVNGTVYAPHYEELLELAVNTVEYPQAVLGSFDPHYLQLPQEVLITAMKEHQGYFSLIGRNGALLPKFITVTNMKLPNMNVIRLGNERVLTARLSDAQYFFREDRKVTLDDRVEQLKGITFHKNLGSLHHKVTRLQEFTPWIAEAVSRGDLKDACKRAARLSKSDLTTGLVGEFPTLQGVMGREYAKQDGEASDVSQSLGELYLPSTPEGDLPDSHVGMIVGLGDRIDTLVAFFLVGLVPSGSEDPFALRRIGYGTVRILVEKGLQLNIVEVLTQAEHIFRVQNIICNPSGATATIQSLVEFILERLRFFAKTVHQVRDDMIEAILTACPVESCDLGDMVARMKALQLVATQPEFSPLIMGYKRAHRIVEKEQWHERQVSPDLFEHEAETNLHRAVCEAQPKMNSSIAQQNYGAALTELLELKTPIDNFFDGVMVNAPDQHIRANRLSLLVTVDQLFLTVADFSCLQG